MSSFKDLRIVDNFYQTSSFFPMPTVLVGTIAENGKTNLGSYSLCFPYYIAGKDRYAMLLECRNSSNTAQNILRSKKASLNFIPDDRKYFREAVRLGFPGDTTDEKMKDCLFTLEDGIAEGERPKVVAEAFQVFECTWNDTLENAYLDKPGCLEGYEPPYRNFNGITSKFGAHFILNIDKILIKPRYYDTIINGVKASGFPPVPVDYGYRDSTNFASRPCPSITATATAPTSGARASKSPSPKRSRQRRETRCPCAMRRSASIPTSSSRTARAPSSPGSRASS